MFISCAFNLLACVTGSWEKQREVRHLDSAEIRILSFSLVFLHFSEFEIFPIVASKMGTILHDMPPPSSRQIELIQQGIASGFVDQIARRSGSSSTYICCRNLSLEGPLILDRNSSIRGITKSRKRQSLPEWICFDQIVCRDVTKPANDEDEATSVNVMCCVTAVDPTWIGSISTGSALVKFGDLILDAPPPIYNRKEDSIMCSIETKFGDSGWYVPHCQVRMYETMIEGDKAGQCDENEIYRWFARYLLEGRIFSNLSNLLPMLNDPPALITVCL